MSEAPTLNFCNGKIGHATAAGAYGAMKAQLNRRKFKRHAGLHLNVYHCARCTQWHVGNTGR